MKKRKGIIRVTFPDGDTVDVPIDPDRESIPIMSGFVGDEPRAHFHPEIPELKVAWWKAQDALDDSAGKRRSGRGGKRKAGCADDKHQRWIEDARMMYQNNPHLTCTDMARRIAERRNDGQPDTIRRVLTKANFES
jgi:hypothetical protein